MADTGRTDRLPEAARMPDLHAGFWMRVGAYMLDGVILSVPAMILYVLLVLPVGLSPMGFPERTWPVVVFYLVLIPARWLYFALFESSRLQATPGKMVLGIVVAYVRGERIRFGRASGRYFAKILSFMIFYIGFLMAGWTLRKQGLHDLIAGTCVVRKQGLEDLSEDGGPEPEPPATRTLPGWAIVMICVGAVFFGGVLLAAILASIALPLYVAYKAGPPVVQAVNTARRETLLVNDFRNHEELWTSPLLLQQLNEGFAGAMPLGRYIQQLQVADCRGKTCSLVVTLRVGRQQPRFRQGIAHGVPRHRGQWLMPTVFFALNARDSSPRR